MKTQDYSLEKVNFMLVDKERMIVSADNASVILTLPKQNIFDLHFSVDELIKMPPKIYATCSELEYQEIKMSEQSKELLEMLKQSIAENLKTSAEWQKLFYKNITDPSGWDKENYKYSWNIELITRQEFEARAENSFVAIKSKWADQGT